MKKVTLIAVGSLKENYFIDASAEYIKRLQRFCDLTIKEIADSGATDAVNKESVAILRASKHFWLLDIDGEQYSSTEFARLVDKAFLSGPLTFVIGGSNGVNSEVKQTAKKRISFGKATYPHQLMRIIFLEQLYRAFSITAGLPYHK